MPMPRETRVRAVVAAAVPVVAAAVGRAGSRQPTLHSLQQLDQRLDYAFGHQQFPGRLLVGQPAHRVGTMHRGLLWQHGAGPQARVVSVPGGTGRMHRSEIAPAPSRDVSIGALVHWCIGALRTNRSGVREQLDQRRYCAGVHQQRTCRILVGQPGEPSSSIHRAILRLGAKQLD